MSIASGQAVTRIFTTAHPATKAPTDADATPTGTLYVNGTADAATVTVTNITTGVYKAAVTLPALSVGDDVDMRIAATVATVATEAVFTSWQTGIWPLSGTSGRRKCMRARTGALEGN